MEKWLKLFITFCISLLLVAPTVEASLLHHADFLHITIKDGLTEYKWKYDHPRRFEYYENEMRFKGRKVKKKIEEIVQLLQLHEQSEIEEIVDRITTSIYPRVERIDIRYMNKEGKHYTWVWEKEAGK